jgi:hypothetical protein
MPATVTVTGVIGPAVTVSATVFSNVSAFHFDVTGKETLTLEFVDGSQPVCISIAAQTTITVTVSGANYTVSVS